MSNQTEPKILDGKALAAKITNELKNIIEQNELDLTLGIIQVGNNSASNTYVKMKMKRAEEIGVKAKLTKLSEETTIEEVITAIKRYNLDSSIAGYILQLPLPEHLAAHKHELIEMIDPSKDIDGLHPLNQGKLFNRITEGVLTPATPTGIMRLLQEYSIELTGKHVVVIGSSNLVGRPVSIMCENQGATVTLCNSKTIDLASHTKRADIIISATGVKGLIKADMFRPETTLIDVGISRREDGKLVGDIDPEVLSQASAYTPVPGGIGPMTIAMLLSNLFRGV